MVLTFGRRYRLMSSINDRVAPIAPRKGGPFTPGERLLLSAFVASSRRLSDGGAIERILVFGSRARGEGDEDSDLDLAVLVSGTAPLSLEGELVELAETVQEGWEDLPHLRPITIRAGDGTNPALLDAVEREGIVLWAKTSV